jgi:hypothetical protein
MKNKKWYLPMLLLVMTMGYSNLKACHEGDFGALNKGHYKWGKNVGIFQYSESITVLTSTSTSCDLYTAYLEDQYQIIQEQVAQGTGAQLDALAYYSGCEKQGVPSFPKKPCMRIMTHYSVQTRIQESFKTRSSGSSRSLPP